MDDLAAAIDGLLETDLDPLDAADLHELVVEVHRQATRLAAAQARILARWDAVGAWGDDGSKAAAARLSRTCGMSSKQAHVELRRARGLRTMPVVAAAFTAGEVDAERVDALVRASRPEVADVFARDEEMLVGQARRLLHGEFRKALTYWSHRADPHGAEERARQVHHDRRVDIAHTYEGTVDIVGVFDPVSGAIVADELARLEQSLFEQDWGAARAEHGATALPKHLARTAGQRRADALVQVARRSAHMPTGAHPGRPLITVLVGDKTLAEVCELAAGTVLAPHEVVPLLGEADIERIVFSAPSRVIEVGRRRSFVGALRRIIEVRDRHCTFPGCEVPAHRCQVDHVVEWSNGGETTQENGRLLCGAHNRARNRAGPAP